MNPHWYSNKILYPPQYHLQYPLQYPPPHPPQYLPQQERGQQLHQFLQQQQRQQVIQQQLQQQYLPQELHRLLQQQHQQIEQPPQPSQPQPSQPQRPQQQPQESFSDPENQKQHLSEQQFQQLPQQQPHYPQKNLPNHQQQQQLQLQYKLQLKEYLLQQLQLQLKQLKHPPQQSRLSLLPQNAAGSFYVDAQGSSRVNLSNGSIEPNKSKERQIAESTKTYDTSSLVKTYEKVNQNLEKRRFLSSFIFFPISITKNSTHKQYKRVKTSTQAKFCMDWSKNLLTPIFPSKKVLQKSYKDFVSQQRKFRQWRAPILFSFNKTYHSDLILCKGVRIPYSHEPGYGNSRLYLGLPKCLGKKLKETPSEYPNLETRDMDLYGHGKEWWKMAKDVDGLFGIVNEVGNFEPKSLESIFKKTQRGITADLVLKIYCEAIAESSKQLKRGYVKTIKLEILQGNIKEIGKDSYPAPGPKTILQTAGFEIDKSLLFQLQMLEI